MHFILFTFSFSIKKCRNNFSEQDCILAINITYSLEWLKLKIKNKCLVFFIFFFFLVAVSKML
jgi:hypothetical protein